jgi:NTP pyrophosphatase (non-canonical NTP hydrolase)
MIRLNAFDQLWQSTIDFHNRFRSVPQSLHDASECVMEEAKEVYQASKELDNAVKLGHPNVLQLEDALADELADEIVTVMGVAISSGIGLYGLSQAMGRVSLKNDKKTRETHYLNPETGKITRRNREQS